MRPNLLLPFTFLLVLGGCSLFESVGLAPNEPDPAVVSQGNTPDEPSHVVVQHVLVSFDGCKLAGVTRTKDEARKLAQKVLEDARRGRNFPDLVRLYSDDRGGGGTGTYALANWGVTPGTDEAERQKMVRGFSNTAFALKTGEVALLEYDESASPFGWHVIKRIR
jgi:peptidyl-prolyl cis-trans isomerase D